MIKRFTVAVAALFALAVQAFAAGTIPYSLSQQLDEFGNPLAGCRLYIIQAGTVSTPQNAYQDSGLTLLLPNPIICDASGRLPQFFLADGSIKVRLTKSNGVNVVTADGILVVGASSGGGGGSPVDPTTVLKTGYVQAMYGTGVQSGFVRMNGRSIGSASSSATERANADTQALFEYLWNTDVNLSVSGGRGASSIADWTANKTLTLPDLRGRILMSLADMGNTAATLTTFTCATPTTLGTVCGAEARPVNQVNLPSYTLPDTLGISSTLGISNSLGISDPGHTHSVSGGTLAATGASNAQYGTSAATSSPTSSIVITAAATNVTLQGSVSLTGSVSKTGSVTSGGSGTLMSALPPIILVTTYIKL